MKTLLFNPFKKYSERHLFIIGVVFTLIGTALGYVFKTRFDGVIDSHIVSDIMWDKVLFDNIINIFCLILFLYISAKYINKKTRIIDIITTSMIARTPIYILPLFNINDVMSMAVKEIIQNSTYGPELINHVSFFSLFLVIVFSIVSILFLVWYIALLFNGFKVASNAKEKISVILFILSVLLAEILSKILIYQFN